MTSLEVIIDGSKCKCAVTDETLLFWPSEPGKCANADYENNSVTLAFNDVICLKYEGSLQKKQTVIHLIKRRDNVPEWLHETLKILPCIGKEDEYMQLVERLQFEFGKVFERRPKRLLLLMNPIGGKRKARKMYDTIVLPLFQLAGINVELIVSERHKHLIEVMSVYNYKSVDGIVMMGGDGTLQQVVNVLIRRTQEDSSIDFNDSSAVHQSVPIPLAIIPTGSGNAVAAQLTGCQDVATSTLHVIKGKCTDLDIISTFCDGKLVGYCTCIMGIGALSDLVNIADRKLRWMKVLRYNAVVNMFPFRRVHYLDTELTFYSSKKENVEQEDAITKDDTTDGDIINQRTSMLMASAMDIWWPGRSRPKGKMFVTTYKEMGGYQMYRTWKKMFFQKDPGFNEAREVNALRIKFNPRPNTPPVYNEMVCLDGELFTCPKPEYFVRVLQGVVQMFSSR